MAGGPISPSSVYLGGAAGRLFPNFYAGGGSNISTHDEGIGVVGSLANDSVAELRFPMPSVIPSGTMKLMLRALGAASGNAKVSVADAAVAGGASPSNTTLTTESGSPFTITFVTSADNYLDTKVTLTATPAANNTLVVGLTFNTASWTVSSTTTWLVWVLWE